MNKFVEYLNIAVEKFSALSFSKKFVLILLAAVFLLAVIIFINPSKRLAEMRNQERRNAVVEIVNAAYQYNKDNDGKLLEILSEEPKMICNSSGSACGDFIDLSEIVNSKKYINKVPVDPQEKTPGSSGYEILKTASGRISVMAVKAEGGAIISSSK